MFDFDIEQYHDEKTYMYCETKEYAEEFMKYLASHGRKWRNGNNYLSYGQQPIDEMVLFFNKGTYSHAKHVFENRDYSHYVSLKYTDFLKDDPLELQISIESLF